MDAQNLSSVLEECKISANTGYEIARTQAKELDVILDNAKEQISQTITDFNNSPCYISDTAKQLQSELFSIQRSFDDFNTIVKNDIYNAKKSLSKFSITLFGRTMAGKSTLMEVLTNGNGKTIGKGAQRTTRDVRKYMWNGLEITDVPGIGAFEGEDDEKIAFESAKSGDLILFLMTDDAPQPKEAECFSRIISLGKPVICIINVRVKLEGSSHKMKMRDLNKKFDMNRLDEIKNQFIAFSAKTGQEWGYFPFVYVHLNAAFQAQHINDKTRSEELYHASRIEYLKRKIAQQVQTRGKFYRIKTFVDLISKPLIDSIDMLLNQSEINASQVRTVLSKKIDLESWKESFLKKSIAQVESYIVNLKSNLNSEVADFAENHFEDENAGKEWEKLLKSEKVEEKAQEVLLDLDRQCTDKIREISREINNELKFLFSAASDLQLNMEKIIDGKRIAEWTTLIVSGGLGIAAGITAIAGSVAAGPLGWIALGVVAIGGLLSLLLKSKDKKEYEARKKLENKLKESISKLCEKLENSMKKNVEIIMNKRINLLCSEMQKMLNVISRLSDTQKELAWKLDSGLLKVNMSVVKGAICLIGAESLEHHIVSAARLPGRCILLMLNNGFRFPDKAKQDLFELVGEKITFVYETDNKQSLISHILGNDFPRDSIFIDHKNGVAHVDAENAKPNLITRIKLAQQLSELLITK